MSNLTLPCKDCLLLGICQPIFKESYIDLYNTRRPIYECKDFSITLLEIRCTLMSTYINYTGSGNLVSNRKPKLNTASKFFINKCNINLPKRRPIRKINPYDPTM